MVHNYLYLKGVLMYYVYVFLSAVGAFLTTVVKQSVKSIFDCWKIIIVFVTIFLLLIWLHASVDIFISIFASRKKQPKKLKNIFRSGTLMTINLFLHIMKAKIHVTGAEKIPDNQRFLMVGNHLSIFDPMIAMYCFRDKELAFVSKKENINMPFFGRLMLASGCIPLDRDDNRSAVKSIMAAARNIAENRASIGIYPEGGINKSEELLLPFHHGSFKIALKAKAPIVVTSIRNTDKLKKRFLWKSTNIYLDVIKVLPYDEISALKTSEISQMTRNDILMHLKTA